MSIVSADGRRLRSERSRQRILGALRRALADPELEFSPALVAARAGVSMSTVFRHFGDLEGLAAAMRALVLGEIEPILRAGFDGDRDTRVRELVGRRITVFEKVSPLERATPVQRLSPGRVADDQRIAALLREQVDAALAAELPDPLLGDAIDALVSLGAWRHLRELRRLADIRAAEVLEAGVLGLLRNESAAVR